MAVMISVGRDTFEFSEENKWFLALLEKAVKEKFYGELNLKLENGVIVIVNEVKKHKPK